MNLINSLFHGIVRFLFITQWIKKNKAMKLVLNQIWTKFILNVKFKNVCYEKGLKLVSEKQYISIYCLYNVFYLVK